MDGNNREQDIFRRENKMDIAHPSRWPLPLPIAVKWHIALLIQHLYLILLLCNQKGGFAAKSDNCVPKNSTLILIGFQRSILPSDQGGKGELRCQVVAMCTYLLICYD